MTAGYTVKKKEPVVPDNSQCADKMLYEERKSAVKPDCPNDFQAKVRKAIEANNLCYDCETGFHYMKQ